MTVSFILQISIKKLARFGLCTMRNSLLLFIFFGRSFAYIMSCFVLLFVIRLRHGAVDSEGLH